MEEQEKLARFEQCIMPQMDAAYNLARWLAGNDPDAQDVVQEAYLRAFKFFGGFRGGDSRSWLLRIVRNSFYDWLRHQSRTAERETPFDEAVHHPAANGPTPDIVLLEKADKELLRQALEALPVEYREVLVMRELEGLSYKEIADVADLPIGTVMSRLARARDQLRQGLTERMQKE
ncbi:MAG TPA: sigma-70 family RNA polymerase sigma factor [Candidatus Sulfotelmatobacter sp.]|nr:sigma-70 family RNA polymerase sigma factor [Candidatus Sulfotelmatobacter sp.]